METPDAPVELVMKFEPSTIEHLGVKMYSHIPPALAELIANSYDACAKNVRIKLYNGVDKKIIIEDDGSGMTFDEINEYFLRIGRNRRKEKQPSCCNRKPTGKKGLGKLALFGLGNKVAIETTKNGEQVTFILNYQDILNTGKSEYSPETKIEKIKDKTISGTIITLNELKHKSAFSDEEYAKSLARLFNFSAEDFDVTISLDKGNPIKIDRKLKYANIVSEFEWNEKEILALVDSTYSEKNKIKGKILTTEKPLHPGLRGLTLFSNGRMINFPEFFGKSESSHFYSYATGWLDVDFVDEWEEDVISTNRQSIDWEKEKTLELKEFLVTVLTAIEKDWRTKREGRREKNIETNTGIDIKNWKKTLPKDIEPLVSTILKMLKTSELESQEQSNAVKALHSIAPEYPNLHWRHIHPELRKVSEKYYINQDYYGAFIEALKRYVTEVKKKSGKTDIDERALMQAVFNKKNRLLSVTKKFKKNDGTNFDIRTIDNIEDGQLMLSEGIVVGGRHPLQHEEIIELSTTGLFSEKDCLDFLSLLSHLFKRLDDSTIP